MKRAWFYIGLMWKPVFFVLLLIGISILLVTYNLKGLTSGFTLDEIQQHKFVSQISNIINNPVNAPINLAQYGFIKLGYTNLVWLRIASCFFAIFSSVIFYILLRKWYTNRIALLTSAMFLSSSWILMTARLGTPEILLTVLATSVLVFFWLKETKKKKLALITFFVSLGILAYIPIGIILLLTGLAWKGKLLAQEARKVPIMYFGLCLLLFIAVMAPLFWAAYRDKTVILNLLGLADKSLTISIYVSNLWANLVGIFYNSSRITGPNIGSTGILDVFSIVLFLAGVLTILRKYGQDKMKFLIFGFIGSFMFAGFNQKVNVTFVLAFAYLIIGTGLAWIMRQWLAVFPRNPIAKNIGISIVIVCVGFSIYFNTYRYFIAWPSMENTKLIYNQKP